MKESSGNFIKMPDSKEEKPYVCEICDKRFKVDQKLKRHMTVHSDERNFQCKLCPSKFKASDVLKRHEKNNSL